MRLELKRFGSTEKTAERLYGDMARRLTAGSNGICPVDLALSFVTMCLSQSCGKCVPCRIGLKQVTNILQEILDGKGSKASLELLKRTAESIAQSADCAIGIEAAHIVLANLRNYPEDYHEHIAKNRCLGSFKAPVPCVEMCPASVDIPGYIALIKDGRYSDAVRLIRKDNPMVTTCGYICDHPCEKHCRRKLLDDALNIRGLKRYAVDKAGVVPPPDCMPLNGKKIAVVGAGPCGLSAAYFLQLMGYQVTIYERRKQLGGMLRYGIPEYRLPRHLLDRDINAILATGVKAETDSDVAKSETYEQLSKENDAVYIAVGAQNHSSIRVEGEHGENVMSAVEMLRKIGDGAHPDFTGKTIVIVGGGNVAMDVTRTSVRLNAAKVYCVYRRRKIDMTADMEEVEGALAEGAEILTMRAPGRIELDKEGKAVALWVKPQLSGKIDASGRPSPVASDEPEQRIAADYVIVAIGQKVEHEVFTKAGYPMHRNTIATLPGGKVFSDRNIFAGGECVTGPNDAIRAIAAGKVAAANIDEFLGGEHEISVGVNIPSAKIKMTPAWGRINTSLRVAFERKQDFNCIENGMSDLGAEYECNRCLRCDYYGLGQFRGGRNTKW